MNGPKNLILCYWVGLGQGTIESFVASLRRTGFAGDVCVCVEGVAAATVAALRAHGIIVERAAPSAQPRMAGPASRYFTWLDVLARHGDEYANVMLTDPAGTTRAADPFASPLPADIVYTHGGGRLGESPADHDAVVQAYGESMAHNMRDCALSIAGEVIGTRSGILRYLVAMTHELSGRATPVTGAIDRGVHNYIVHMRQLPDAWLGTSPRPGPLARAAGTATDAVLAFYHRERDAAWLPLFLGSLRCASETVSMHCIGDFAPDEQALLSRHRCVVHYAPAVMTEIAENVAHFYLAKLLDQLSVDRAEMPEQVLVLDGMHAVFPRDPFRNATLGLSVFCEGPGGIGDSAFNLHRLGHFVMPDEDRLQRSIISSSVMRGRLPVVRDFYRRLLAEFLGRANLLTVPKVIQGAVNKLCRGDGVHFPVVAHPNGAEVYFDLWPSGLAVDDRHGVRIGGTVPGVVLGTQTDSELMTKLRIDLGLSDA